MALSPEELQAKIAALKAGGKGGSPEASKALTETAKEVAAPATTAASLEAQLAALKAQQAAPAVDPVAALEAQIAALKAAPAPEPEAPAEKKERAKRKSSDLLGKSVIDSVSGFAGTATERHEQFEGAIKYLVEAPVKDSKTSMGWYLAGRLVLAE